MAGHRPFRDLVKHTDEDPARRARVEEEKRAMEVALALSALRERRGGTQTAIPLMSREPAERRG
jgi:hypothetical protein